MATATVTPIRREFQVHRFDAIRHGVLSRHIAMPWEDRAAFEEILRGLLVEHQPQGPTAYHLVEDLAEVIWRKRRLLQAEGAAIRQKLYGVGQTQGAERVAKFALAHEGGGMRTSIAEIMGGHLPRTEGLASSLASVGHALATLDDRGADAFARALEGRAFGGCCPAARPPRGRIG